MEDTEEKEHAESLVSTPRFLNSGKIFFLGFN